MTEYVPGLKPQKEEGQGGGRRSRKEGRTKTQEPQSRASLRPSASPGNYYNRPAQPQKNRKADQFISALGQVSDVSGKLGQYMYEKQQKEAELQAQSEIQSMSMEEAGEKVRSGELGKYDNPYFQDAFQRQYGIRLGLHKGREMRSEYEAGFNPRTDDVDSFIQSHLDPEMEQMANNPIIQEAFTETVDEDVQKVREADYSDKAAAMEQDTLDGAYETGMAIFEKPLADASTPEERQQAIEEGHQAWRDGYAERRELLGLSNAEQDTLTMQMAAKFAREGDVDVVEKLLTDERGGVGSIIDTRGKKGAEAAQILSTATSNAEDDNRETSFKQRMGFFNQSLEGQLDEDELIQWHQSNPGAYSDAKVQSLIRKSRSVQDQKREARAEQERTSDIRQRQDQESMTIVEEGVDALLQGNADVVQNAVVTNDDGEPELMPREEVLEEVEKYFVNTYVPEEAARRASKNPNTTEEEEAFNLMLDVYSNNSNLEPTQWKDTMNNVGGTIDQAAAAAESEEDLPPKFRRAYTLWNRIRVRNPRMASDLVGSEMDRNILETVRLAEQYGGKSLPQAVNKAYRVSQNEDFEDNPSLTFRYGEIDDAMRDVDGVDADGNNSSYVSTELRKLGRHVVRSGGPTGEQALSEAVRRFNNEHTLINGWQVPTQGKNVPNNFKVIAEDEIEAYIEAHPDEDLEADQLTMFPVGGRGATQTWGLMEVGTGSTVEDRMSGMFTISELERRRDKRAEERRRDKAERKLSGEPLEPQTPEQRARESRWGEQNAGGNPLSFLSSGSVWDVATGALGAQQKPSEGAVGRAAQSGIDLITRDPEDIRRDLGEDEIDVSEGERVPSSGTLQGAGEIDAGGNIQTGNPGEVKLPDTLDPKMKGAVQKLREAGFTKQDFDERLEKLRGEPVRWAGTANDGSPLDTTFGVNPTIRETIRQYLPSAEGGA